ncbi:MAG TPA: GtrA family protein, partial [Streptosporangiaceae bacterium]
MKYISDIYRRFTVLIHEILKFAIVGGIGFVVQISVTDGLHLGLGVGPVSATAIGYVISAAVTFLGNRHWAFKHRQGKGLRHETLMFVFLNAIALGIQEAVVAIVHYGMHQTGGVAFNIATLLGIGLGTIFRLWSYRKFVFLEVEEAPSLAEQVKPVITGHGEAHGDVGSMSGPDSSSNSQSAQVSPGSPGDHEQSGESRRPEP